MSQNHGELDEESVLYEDEDPNSLPKMVAAYDYAGEQNDDLTFWEGDIITVMATFEDGWWLGMR
jgi:hypothetical protein